MSWGAQNRSKDAKTPNIGPAMSEKPIFYQLFNKLTPLPARPSDLKLAHWKPGINLLSEGGTTCYYLVLQRAYEGPEALPVACGLGA